ncbi:zinc-dependent alcohol dehydrogenase [Sporolactobacillus sp. KGMB 08714]|uniref:zinc-dependent alcohol dehydrogenase n=1 Tax=Sporolactobacillus sp. KGMB 08714 TaxID=3064704 RepID=UPI002FBDC076
MDILKKSLKEAFTLAELMKAAIFEDVGKITVKEIPKPVVKSDEVLVRLKTCAICTWEQRVYQGINKVAFPFIGGHEEAGVIVEIGNDIDRKLWSVGDRVVVGLLTSCGECTNCRIGEEGSCENFSYENFVGGLNISGMGGFSEYLSVPISKLFKIKGNLPYEIACLTEPLSCVVHSIERAQIRLGENVVVVGAGIMGMFHAVLARQQGARVIVIEPNENRITKLHELGFEEVIDPKSVNSVDVVKELTDGRGADVVLNTVGISSLAEESIAMAALYGRVILYSSYHPDEPITISPNTLHRRMTKLMGSANSNTRDFETALTLLNDGIIKPEPFIAGTVKLDDIEHGIKTAIDPNKYRIIVEL